MGLDRGNGYGRSLGMHCNRGAFHHANTMWFDLLSGVCRELPSDS